MTIKEQKKRPPHYKIGITCVGGHFIYDIIRAFRRAEDFTATIIGLDVNPDSCGKVLVDHFEEIPLAKKSAPAYIKKILGICRKYQLDLFIPSSEGETRAVARHSAQFRKAKVKTTVTDDCLVDLMTDKFRMLDFLKKKGFATGAFLPVGSQQELRGALKALGYPRKKAVLKQRQGSGSRSIFILDAGRKAYQPLLKDRLCGTGSFEVVTQVLAKDHMGFGNHLVMPYYGHDVFDIDCLSVNGEMADCIPRLRQYHNPLSPVNEGCRITMRADIIDYVRRLCRTFAVHGVCDYDIALDDDGQPRLLDASCRLSGSVGASLAAGVNIPAQLIRIIFGLPLRSYPVRDGTTLRPFNHIVAVG